MNNKDITRYYLLINPGHSRVYYSQAAELALAELSVAIPRLSANCSQGEISEQGGIPYISFTADTPLSTSDLRLISELSFVFSLFTAVEFEGNTALIPVHKTNAPLLPYSLSELQRYTGKTNELMTRMMVNMARMYSGVKDGDTVKLLDPVAGRGTTLFEGLILGCDVYGIEVADNAVHDTVTYLKKFLTTERVKHSSKQRKLSGQNKSFTAKIHTFNIKQGDTERTFEMVSGDTLNALSYYKKGSFDVIAGDLPYGVQHGVVSRSQKGGSITRNPEQLLEAALPVWAALLAKGGCLALSFNNLILPTEKVKQLAISAGLSLPEQEVNLTHRVDSSIVRDIVFFIK